ncbi:uncharacterized protein I303_100364 [Kwoniella dejecticola CBS 10117]|uniref:Tetrapyrrole biosynthesis uroporphyrinogen III synthase domain-containing protein n=1 Tax=Kwoniella dejecticola CBS 10117 TaxID=1296121 RepID=A0A1A6AEP9_9TREE|nr:uncharacterized protein I303_00364 [Kwoniella dejecticola CBS 10117]OBR88547.1 hypothetical protein I303_00364 [Kwoniella dejecticola CBS 10117]
MSTSTPIILFKTPSPTVSLDPYYQTLTSTSSSSSSSSSRSSTSSTYDPTFIPVLEETYTTIDLVPIIEAGPSKWEGVIITSRRGAEGWVRAVSQIDSDSRKGKGKEKADASGENWDTIPLFTAGTASSQHLMDSQIPQGYIPRIPEDAHEDVPKSAIHLIPLILQTSPRSSSKDGYKPYLFVRGDKSTDNLQDGLREHGRIVEEVMVYRTTPRGDILENLELFKRSRREEKRKGWLAFFSPSGAEVVWPLLDRRLLHHSSQSNEANSATEIDDDVGKAGPDAFWGGWKVCAIGETTKRYLEEKGIKVDAVAEQPNPQGLLEAIRCPDEQNV